MRVACAFDHAGFPFKPLILAVVADEGHEILDLGTDSLEPVDYPDTAMDVAAALTSGVADRGLLVCGSGAGVAIAACKVPGVRAATAHDTYTAHQAVEHDDINALCLGARVVGPSYAEEIVRAFLRASFSGEERHVRRLAKVLAIEERYSAIDPPPTA